MSVFYTEATPSLGNTKVKLVLSIASMTAPKLATEINAATSFDVTLTFRDWDPQVNTNSGQAPARLGTTTQMPQEGLSQYQGIEVRYPYDPQEDDTDPNNDAKALLTRGTVLYAVVRKGPDAEDPFAVGDRVEVWKIRAGRQNRGKSGTDEFAEFEIMQMVFPMREEENEAVVAT